MEKTAPTARLNFTLFFSVIIHLVILLGVGFTVSSPPNNPSLTSLDITLVKQQTEIEPEEADFLAQANNEGGGETDKKAPDPKPDAKHANPISAQASKTKPTPPAPIEKSAKVLTQAKAERHIQTTEQLDDRVKPVIDVALPTPPQLKASDLILQAKSDIKMLNQKLDQAAKKLSKKPKRRYLSPRTKQYSAAAYHEAWRKKVERICNMNYPKEAKRKSLNGSLMLSVDINPDGSVPVNGIVISRSSGHDILDKAAIKIVRIGAPYAPIPDDILQDNDVITIIRTWKFETDVGVRAR